MRYTFITKQATTCGSRVTLPRSVNYESNGDRWTDAETGKALTPAQVQIAKRNALEYKQRLRGIGTYYKKAAADADADTAKPGLGGSLKDWFNGLSDTERQALTIGASGLIGGLVGGALYSPKQRLRNAIRYAVLGATLGAGYGAIHAGVRTLCARGLESMLEKPQSSSSEPSQRELIEISRKHIRSVRWCGTPM